MAIMTLVEQTLNGQPDLICLAGYDLWIGNWMVNRYFPRILNVHPADAENRLALVGYPLPRQSWLTKKRKINGVYGRPER